MGGRTPPCGQSIEFLHGIKYLRSPQISLSYQRRSTWFSIEGGSGARSLRECFGFLEKLRHREVVRGFEQSSCRLHGLAGDQGVVFEPTHSFFGNSMVKTCWRKSLFICQLIYNSACVINFQQRFHNPACINRDSAALRPVINKVAHQRLSVPVKNNTD